MKVALVGGPGTGKTTLSMNVVARLKEEGMHAHFVNEYARSWMEKHNRVPDNPMDQLALYRGQKKREDEASSAYDIILVDSCLWMCACYGTHLIRTSNGHFNKSDIITAMDCLEDSLLDLSRYDLMFHVPRVFGFDPTTRVQQSLAEAAEMDAKILGFINLFNIPVEYLPEDPSVWVDIVMEKIIGIEHKVLLKAG